MKIIFLDFDGVLNSTQSTHFYVQNITHWNRPWKHTNESYDKYAGEICIYAVSNLLYLLNSFPDTRVVVSSTWRMSKSTDWFNGFFEYLDLPQVVIGETPVLRTQRGIEIQEWLNDHPEVTDFVILDDDCDMAHFVDTKHFIHVDGEVGLDWKVVNKVKKLFGKYDLTYSDLQPNTAYSLFSRFGMATQFFFDDKTGEVFYNNNNERHAVFFYKNSEFFSYHSSNTLGQCS